MCGQQDDWDQNPCTIAFVEHYLHITRVHSTVRLEAMETRTHNHVSMKDPLSLPLNGLVINPLAVVIQTSP